MIALDPSSFAPFLSDEADFGRVALLALVQGLTEFLPVSSSGHLVLVQSALAVHVPGMVLEIALHVGTLLAVLLVYRADLLGLLRALFAGRPREIALLAVGTLPTVAVALLIKDHIDAAFGDARSAAYGLCFTALLLVAGDFGRRARPREGLRGELTFRDALFIGTAQAVAILPGVSRSGSTISVGLMLGLAPEAAARFSFLLSVPAILGACVLTGRDLVGGTVSAPPTTLLLFGVAVAALVGWAALRVLLAFLGRGAFRWFAAYCAVLGLGYLAFA